MNDTDTQRSVSHGDELLRALVRLGVVMRCKRWSSAHNASARALSANNWKTVADVKDSELRTGAALRWHKGHLDVLPARRRQMGRNDWEVAVVPKREKA